MLSSYSSIYTLGHRAARELFMDEVVVQEKLDGSQVSIAKINGELMMRSKGVQINMDNPDKMFSKAVTYVKSIEHKLTPGWTYRGEYFSRPKHNTLAYSRIPNNHIAIFDIDLSDQQYMSPDLVNKEAERLGFETVPTYFVGKLEELTPLLTFMDQQSFLGGPKIEGLVVKNYSRFDDNTKKVLMAKYVSAEFKEAHKIEWKNTNPTSGDILQRLVLTYKVDARWRKAVQTLRDNGQLTDMPKDIGELIKAVKDDIQKECMDEIKDTLYAWAKDHVLRGVTSGLPEWYKNELFNKSMSNDQS